MFLPLLLSILALQIVQTAKLFWPVRVLPPVVDTKAIQVPPQRGPQDYSHQVCSKCGKIVARYGNAEDGSLQCANCLNGNL